LKGDPIMFDTLFRYPAIVARHQGGRFVAARELFLNHCARQGMTRATLQRYAQELLVVAERIDIAVAEVIESSVIDAAADHWAREQHQRRRVGGLRWSRELFVQTATDWLGFLGRLEVPKPRIVPFADRIADFSAYRRDERGLSPATIRNQNWHVEKFLTWLDERNRSFGNVSLEDVDAFLAATGKRGWGRVSVATSAKALRAFFKHAAIRGWCTATIATGIDGPRLFRHEGLPAGPSWPDVKRLIATTVGDSARDIRDRAILILLATYGLRSGEVSGLRLEDVNWESEKVSIWRSKQRRAQEYPLVSEAGEAILHYLQEARPSCAQREIFLTSKAPFHRLSQGALYHLVSTRLSMLGIHTPRRGPHALRHACAGHLVTERFSLKEIGDHLGHSSAFATRIYAKVDLAGLREVANFDLGGLR
jgi:integrase/recombinase XerD